MPTDPRDVILSLAEKLWICSRLLTCAAERLPWDSIQVRSLMVKLEAEVSRELDSLGEDELEMLRRMPGELVS